MNEPKGLKLIDIYLDFVSLNFTNTALTFFEMIFRMNSVKKTLCPRSNSRQLRWCSFSYRAKSDRLRPAINLSCVFFLLFCADFWQDFETPYYFASLREVSKGFQSTPVFFPYTEQLLVAKYIVSLSLFALFAGSSNRRFTWVKLLFWLPLWSLSMKRFVFHRSRERKSVGVRQRKQFKTA